MKKNLEQVLAVEEKAISRINQVNNEKAKTWELIYGVYHCGNCGRIPIYINIHDMICCMYCMTGKTHYVTKKGHRMPIKTTAQWEDFRRKRN